MFLIDVNNISLSLLLPLMHFPLCCCLVAKLYLTLLRPHGLVTCQAPPAVGFPRQDYWSGLLCPSPGDLLDPGIEPASPPLAGRFFTTEPPRKLHFPLRFISVTVFMTQVLRVLPQTLRALVRGSGRTQHELGTLCLKAFSWPLLGQVRWACS